jgi:hypothetical protein
LIDAARQGFLREFIVFLAKLTNDRFFCFTQTAILTADQQ